MEGYYVIYLAVKTKKICTTSIIILLLTLLPPAAALAEEAVPAVRQLAAVKRAILATYSGSRPSQWQETVTGVKTRIAGDEKLLALTFDLCGSPRGMGFDRRITDFLEREGIPATIFVSGRWIGPNIETFRHLATTPLFEIANHGTSHRPASINGRAAYGIAGTRNIGELVDEIEANAERIAALTGKRPRFYRSGTAYYDEVAVKIANDLGHQVAGFSLLGDAGATYGTEQVAAALLAAKPGDIVILHLNHPESGTAEGLLKALPELRKRGFRFVRLADVPLK